MGNKKYGTYFIFRKWKTLRFENVTNIKQDSYITSMVEFKYISASDGKKKRACFSLNSVIGISTDKEDFDVNSLF